MKILNFVLIKHEHLPFQVPRPMSPSQTMKERTMLATFHLARTMARQRGEEDERTSGRLLKGRSVPNCYVLFGGRGYVNGEWGVPGMLPTFIETSSAHGYMFGDGILGSRQPLAKSPGANQKLIWI